MNAPEESSSKAWFAADSTFLPALISSVVCWFAFPPVGASWLAWIAPIGWLTLVLRPTLAGSRPYRKLWLAGFVFWVLAVHWIRLPHPANHLALTALAGYLGCYLPVFIAIARVGVHRLRLPLWLVAPIAWTGLDWLRHHLMTGFGFGSLAHTQINFFLEITQISDLVGEYGVSFLVILVASCFTKIQSYDPLIHLRSRLRFTLFQLLPGFLAFGAALSYGMINFQGKYASYNRAQDVMRVALIQGHTLADWKSDLAKQQQIMQQYMQLSLDAGNAAIEKDGRKVDLYVWPETSFRQTLATVEPGLQLPAGMVDPSYFTAAPNDLAEFVRQTDAAILAGIDRVHIYPNDHGHPDFKAYNSSVLMDAQQQILGTYDKMHRVPFGEYIPFADWFPMLYQLTPLTGGVQAGKQPTIFDFDGVQIAPNICYETCVPHLIRQQVIFDKSTAPDVLISLTNNSWYWGSSELDMHLACGVFRAVETGRPLLIAANGGLSAHIDPSGEVRQVTNRQSAEYLLVDLKLPAKTRLTFYTRYGDWFAILCVVCCVVLAIVGWTKRHKELPSST